MLNPTSFDEYVGQKQVIENLKVCVKGAETNRKILDHVLLAGPAGLGKTSLAEIIAKEVKAPIIKLMAPLLTGTSMLDLFDVMSYGTVLFIDEIHALAPKVEEALYDPIDNFKWRGKSILPFTLIGATTKEGGLSKPLRSRFTIVETFNFYTVDELKQVIKRSALLLNINIDDDGATIVAQRSRGIPRLANQNLKRLSYYSNVITREIAQNTLDKALGIDENGLDRVDINILETIHKSFNNGPVGIESLSSIVDEDLSTLESLREPFLVRSGFLQRGSKGRSLTSKAIEYLERKNNG